MIEYHADDFGLFVEQSKRILRCIDEGMLNGISIMPNSPMLCQCMSLLEDRNVRLTVHLNLVEGMALSTGERLNYSFGKLLFYSYIPFVRAAVKAKVRTELVAQIKETKGYFNGAPMRMDSHVHFHMIPVVFDALMEAICETEVDVSYIRMPKEDLSVYKRVFGSELTIKPVNRLKVIILNALYKRNKRKWGTKLSNMWSPAFSGVLFSGEMTGDKGIPIANYYKKYNLDAEILFHPGGVYEKSDIAKLTHPDDVAFLTSDMRNKEAEALLG